MKNICKALVLCFFLPLLAAAGVVAEEKLPGAMVIDGSWHGDEVKAQDGETWLGLVEEESGFALREVKIAVTIVEDEVVDVPPAKTGKKISVPKGIEPLVMLRNLPQLKVGPVATAEIVDRDFNAGKATGIYFDGMMYELVIQCDKSAQGKKLADCPLQLVGSSSKQSLTNYPIYHPGTAQQSMASEAFPQVFWAGDLDGDGHLDLVLDLTDHYNVSAPTLLLSSPAKAGELVRPVAEFRTTGC